MGNKKWTPFIGLMLLALAGLACQTLLGADETPTPEPKATQVSPEDQAPSATEEPEAAEEPASSSIPLGDEVRVDASGFAFRPPAGYSVSDDFGFVSAEAPDADSDLGPALLMLSDEDAEPVELETLFADALSDVDVPVVEERETTVAGLPARLAEVEGQADEGQEAHGLILVVLVESGRTFTLFASAPVDRWTDFAPVVEAVIETITFFEPVPEEITGGPGEVPEDEPDAEPATGDAGDELRQWASGATASSEFDSPEWGAVQATGAPDTEGCDDQPTAWASADPDGYDYLEVTYDTPVFPSEINIYQSFNPDQVSSIEVLDEDGNYREIYFEVPTFQECPYLLTVPVEDAFYRIVAVKIWVDQAFLADLSWNEIDAVELVGLRGGASAPVIETPAGFLWQSGGESNFEEGNFSVPDGIDVDGDGLIYVADNIQGIYVLDRNGEIVDLIENDAFNNPSDVKVGPDGNLYVANWGTNQVIVINPEGEQLLAFGEEGTGEGQFGGFSPQRLTVGADGRVYVLDNNEDEDGDTYERVQVFSDAGEFLFDIRPDDFVVPNDLEIGPDGNLYLLGFFSDTILKYTADGEFVEELGAEALEFRSPQDLAIDQDGNFYATTWSDDPVVKLDPEGNLLAVFGVNVEDGGAPLYPGSFYTASGIAVEPDGSQVYVSDWTGSFAYVSAFRFE